MSLWDAITHLFVEQDGDQEHVDRSAIRQEIREMRTTRERVETQIDALQQQAEGAIQQYQRQTAGRPDLAGALREARRQVGSPVRDGETE